MVDAPAPRLTRGAFAVLGIFVLGIVFGVALSVVIVHHGGRFSPLHGRRDGPVAIERMTRQLGLDAAQQEKIRAILERAHATVRGVLEDTRRDVRAELRPEQQSKFDRMHPPEAPR